MSSLNKQDVYHLTKTSEILTYNTIKGQRWDVFGHRSQPPVQYWGFGHEVVTLKRQNIKKDGAY